MANWCISPTNAQNFPHCAFTKLRFYGVLHRYAHSWTLSILSHYIWELNRFGMWFTVKFKYDIIWINLIFSLLLQKVTVRNELRRTRSNTRITQTVTTPGDPGRETWVSHLYIYSDVCAVLCRIKHAPIRRKFAVA